MKILQHFESEAGTLRQALAQKHGIVVEKLREITGMVSNVGTQAPITLFSYVRPSNGQRLWLIEVELFFPPDVQLWRSYVLEEEPTDEQIREIVAKDQQV